MFSEYIIKINSQDNLDRAKYDIEMFLRDRHNISGTASNDFTIEMHPEKEPQIHGLSNESHWEITLVDTGLNTLKGGRIKRLEKYIKGRIALAGQINNK